ncbi:amidohydrolase [Salicibibacter kimchii]|uniref:Amidohydrolase n=2 Tax=Salicibibacter kimchii TaxID=2099786 RepID=A0A345C447_9BACI|nr:amidohydrolase [Salicibibacter kimchii]
MIVIRRDLHMHPIISHKEVRTPEVIAEYLTNLGLEVKTNVGGRGVVGILRGAKPGKTVGIRADFDALPINEKNDVPYKSKFPGVMHACGHDAHTAIALGLAKAFSEWKHELAGNIVFIHQHAEEAVPGGAKYMVEDGALEGVDAVFTTHMENAYPVGKVIYRHGYIMAFSDRFEIEVIGQGGHGAFPHQTSDAVMMASQLENQLQTIVSRKIDPLDSAVISIGSIHGGEGANTIADSVILKGTIRTFSQEVREAVIHNVKKITAAVTEAGGGTYRLDYEEGHPATWNHPEETDIIVDSGKAVVGKENVTEMPPQMGGEDFSHFLNKVPGSYFFTGSANAEKRIVYPYHHNQFDIDEEAMVIGAKTLAKATILYNEKNN